MNEQHTCCVFGHRTITETEALKKALYNVIEEMILKENVHTFLFGSRSQFNDLCLETVTKIKEKYPHVKRVYVRAEYPFINEEYKNYLSERFEDTYYPERIIGSGRSVYIERNFEMIDNSRFCIIYYDKENAPRGKKSGTGIARDYAVKKEKHIINLSILK